MEIIFDIVVIILLVLIVWLQISTKLFIDSVHIDLYKNIHLVNTRVIQIIGSINILGKDINDLKSIIINRTNHGSKIAQPVTKEQFDKAQQILNNSNFGTKVHQDMEAMISNNSYPYIPIKDTLTKVTTTKTIVPAIKMLRFDLVNDGDTLIATNKEIGVTFFLDNDTRLHYKLRKEVKNHIAKCILDKGYDMTLDCNSWMSNQFKIIINKTK